MEFLKSIQHLESVGLVFSVLRVCSTTASVSQDVYQLQTPISVGFFCCLVVFVCFLSASAKQFGASCCGGCDELKLNNLSRISTIHLFTVSTAIPKHLLLFPTLFPCPVNGTFLGQRDDTDAFLQSHFPILGMAKMCFH